MLPLGRSWFILLMCIVRFGGFRHDKAWAQREPDRPTSNIHNYTLQWDDFHEGYDVKPCPFAETRRSETDAVKHPADINRHVSHMSKYDEVYKDKNKTFLINAINSCLAEQYCST
ncbi:hypothetical protein GGI35DRAFT_60635 [Trichoderma velutinum]